MQEYGAIFASIYNQRWKGFADTIAPLIRDYYEGMPIAEQHRTLLDVACGTGQLARHFLEHGYRVVGIDLSRHMLHHARENVAEYVEAGQAEFIQANASDFAIGEQFGLVVSTYDALNHLPDADALHGCFRSVLAALVKGGVFVFDLNTRKGLLEGWNSIIVQDTEEMTIINRGGYGYDGEGERAYTRITGFVRRDDGLYERFAETFYNTMFPMESVREWLLDTGFRTAHISRGRALGEPVDEPEELLRAYFVAVK